MGLLQSRYLSHEILIFETGKRERPRFPIVSLNLLSMCAFNFPPSCDFFPLTLFSLIKKSSFLSHAWVLCRAYELYCCFAATRAKFLSMRKTCPNLRIVFLSDVPVVKREIPGDLRNLAYFWGTQFACCVLSANRAFEIYREFSSGM